MEKHKHLPPISRLIGDVRPPGSKSIANRVLPLAALGMGATPIENIPDGEDVNLMRAALEKLGVSISSSPRGGILVEGTGGNWKTQSGSVDLFLGNSGTATRILTALLAAGHGIFRIDGIPRMRERPIKDLVDALQPLAGPDGTRILYEGKEGYPPLRIEARGLKGGHTRICGDLSSQFVTGLLMALPLCREDTDVEVDGKLVSAPYVDLTVHVMRKFGAVVEHDNHRVFRMKNPKGYNLAVNFPIEPDASSASYFLAAGAIGGGPVTVTGLREDSPQGEIGFTEILKRMGARVDYGLEGITVSRDFEIGPVRAHGDAPLQGIDADMDLMSDTGMTLAVTALFAEGPTTIRNIGNWRVKETDRIKAMATELRKLGAVVEEGADSLIIHPPAALTPNVEIDTYDDHRMAMCFSLVCLGPRGVPVTIRDPGCVRKTYPLYYEDFEKLARA